MNSEEKDEGAETIAEQKTETTSERQNVTKPTVTHDQIDQSKDLEQGKEILASETKFADGNDQHKDLTSTATIMIMGHDPLPFPLLPFDDLRPQDRVGYSDLKSAQNQVSLGKYLLCQTITPAKIADAIYVTVTDPEGVYVMRIILQNYSFEEKSALELDSDDILPQGSFLVLKNPQVISDAGEMLTLYCDNPAEVELISKKRLEGKFLDLEWDGLTYRDEMALEVYGKRLFWSEFIDDEAAFAKLKWLGNNGFVGKKFSVAIRFYDMALDYCAENQEKEAMIRSNKSAALLALGCFNAAIKCAEIALEVDPGNEKYIYRKTKALIGLGKYEEGLNFLEEKFNQFSSLGKSKDCKSLLDCVKFLCSRKNDGPTEAQLLSIQMGTLKKEDSDKIPEFTGPVAIVSEIGGKGRGVVATEDIVTGQLLICTKAFGYQDDDKSLAQLQLPYAGQLVGKIANKLAFDPQLGPQLYNLTAGAELGHFESGEGKSGQVDMERIEGIVKINAFVAGKDIINKSEDFSTGLWIFPSFLNHSCWEHNCTCDISGKVMVVFATSEIKKGDELTLAYIKPIFSYETRTELNKTKGFICNCKLCQLDASEPISVRNERQRILNNLSRLNYKCGPWDIKDVLNDVEKLVSLRKDNVSLNLPLLSPEVFRLANILVGKGRLGDAISLLSQMNQVARSSSCWYGEGIEVSIRLFLCHVERRDKGLTKSWMTTVKGMVMSLFGSLEPLLGRLEGEVDFEYLKQQFDIDVFAVQD